MSSTSLPIFGSDEVAGGGAADVEAAASVERKRDERVVKTL